MAKSHFEITVNPDRFIRVFWYVYCPFLHIAMLSLMSKRILLVEDDDINQIIVEHILAKEGLEIAMASNGEEAIEEIRKEAYDLILMDIEMPIMGGMEATPIIRQLPHGKKVPIVALTAHSIPEKLQEFGEVGMDDYVVKPLDQPKAQAIIEKYLGEEEAPDEETSPSGSSENEA